MNVRLLALVNQVSGNEWAHVHFVSFARLVLKIVQPSDVLRDHLLGFWFGLRAILYPRKSAITFEVLELVENRTPHPGLDPDIVCPYP